MITREEYSKMFQEEIAKMHSLTMQKNHDYGGESDPWKNFRTFGMKGILVRMGDKFSRLQTAIWEGREFKVKETLLDTIRDLAVYCVILMIWIRTEDGPNEPRATSERM